MSEKEDGARSLMQQTQEEAERARKRAEELKAQHCQAAGVRMVQSGFYPRGAVYPDGTMTFTGGLSEEELKNYAQTPFQEMKAVKFDEGRPAFHLLDFAALQDVAWVLTFGAKKYEPNNWRLGMNWSRCFRACLSHLFAWWRGEDRDPESGLPHLAHAACSIMFLQSYERNKRGTDDRYIE